MYLFQHERMMWAGAQNSLTESGAFAARTGARRDHVNPRATVDITSGRPASESEGAVWWSKRRQQ